MSATKVASSGLFTLNLQPDVSVTIKVPRDVTLSLNFFTFDMPAKNDLLQSYLLSISPSSSSSSSQQWYPLVQQSSNGSMSHFNTCRMGDFELMGPQNFSLKSNQPMSIVGVGASLGGMWDAGGGSASDVSDSLPASWSSSLDSSTATTTSSSFSGAAAEDDAAAAADVPSKSSKRARKEEAVRKSSELSSVLAAARSAALPPQSQGGLAPSSSSSSSSSAAAAAAAAATTTAAASDDQKKRKGKDAVVHGDVEHKPKVGKGSDRVLTGNLALRDVVIGAGNMPSSGKLVAINYSGSLPDGTLFDKNMNHKSPLTFRLGLGQVVKGLEMGIQGMRCGGERIITIPPELGYGKKKMGNIPPGSTLVFHIKLLEVGAKVKA